MYLLKSKDRYSVQTEVTSVSGELRVVKDYMQHTANTYESEVERALSLMHELDHNRACFGVSGMLLYTDKVEEFNALKAELKAIATLRQEFKDTVQAQGRSSYTDSTFLRLISLYSGLNINKLIEVIERK